MLTQGFAWMIFWKRPNGFRPIFNFQRKNKDGESGECQRKRHKHWRSTFSCLKLSMCEGFSLLGTYGLVSLCVSHGGVCSHCDVPVICDVFSFMYVQCHFSFEAPPNRQSLFSPARVDGGGVTRTSFDMPLTTSSISPNQC